MAQSKDASKGPGQPEPRPGEATGANRRRYYRTNVDVRFRILSGDPSNRVWAYSERERLPYFYLPKEHELQDARALLAEVPQETLELSEGGMRFRVDPQREDLKGLGYGRRTRNKRVRVLLELADPDGATLLQLPAWVVRVDQPSKRLRFVAMAFMEVPNGISQILQSFILRAERRRLRHVLLGGHVSEEGESARQLLRLERGDLERMREQQQQQRRQPKPRGKSFP